MEKGCGRQPICRDLVCYFNWAGRGVSHVFRGYGENVEQSDGKERPWYSCFLNVTWVGFVAKIRLASAFLHFNGDVISSSQLNCRSATFLN